MAKHTRSIIGALAFACLLVAAGVVSPVAASGKHSSVACLADNIYYEAAREPYAGKVAVAQVALNRAAGGDVCAAVYEWHRSPEGKRVAAFSWTLGWAWRDMSPRDPAVYLVCQDIARRMIEGSLRSVLIDDRVKWYHAEGLAVQWRHQFVCKIGHHLFYR